MRRARRILVIALLLWATTAVYLTAHRSPDREWLLTDDPTY